MDRAKLPATSTRLRRPASAWWTPSCQASRRPVRRRPRRTGGVPPALPRTAVSGETAPARRAGVRAASSTVTTPTRAPNTSAMGERANIGMS